MKSYTIHLLRHGITDGNLRGQYIGSTNLPLCEQGEQQLRELAEKYDYPGAGAFITSPLIRCRQSLALLYPGAKQIDIEGLRECDFGAMEGMTADDLKESKSFSEWMAADAESSPFGGESGEHFSERVCAAFESIVQGLMKTGTTSCVIMTHMGVISLLLSRYGLPQALPTDWFCEPGCGYSVRIHPQLWMSGRVMEVYDKLPLKKQPEEDEEE